MIKKEYPRIFTIAEKHDFKEIYNDNTNSLTFENEDYTLYIELEEELFIAHVIDEYYTEQIAKIVAYDYVTFQYELEKLFKRLENKNGK